jgi:hypothetical protein
VFIKEITFKMSDWMTLKTLILPRMFAVTIDLSSAFHHLGVVPSLRRLLCFRYNNTTYRYVGLPLGLRSAPRLFCEALGATMNAVRLRWRGVTSFAYMDDVVLLHADCEYLRTSALEIVNFLRWLGWTPNLRE